MTAKLKILIVILLISFISCERDDICIDDITPQLIIRFYNNDDQEKTKSISQLSVKINGIENDSLIFTATDSIAIPIKVTEDLTQYVLTQNSNDPTLLNRDTLTVSYSREDKFVGRACGFETLFNNVNFDLTQDSSMWIQSFEKTTEQIENETKAHVKIFH
jgi:hypothetical protein